MMDKTAHKKSSSKPKIKVLVVDDESALSRIIKLNLEQTGQYTALTENRGTHVCETALDFMPDVILLDVIMPDINGPEVAKRIKSDDHLKHIAIGFLTATVMKEQVKAMGYMLDGYPCMYKPIGINDLTAFLSRILKDKAA